MAANLTRVVTICVCTHKKAEHRTTKKLPNGPCAVCGCTGFTPEPLCRCGHGKKAHAKGPCHESYLCGCRGFREADDEKKGGAEQWTSS